MMSTSAFDVIMRSLPADRPAEAIAELVEYFTRTQDFHRLFEARTMLARHELGLPLLSRSNVEQLDPSVRNKLEDRLVEACRDIGAAMLDAGDITGGFQYLQMIGEIEPVRAKIEAVGSPDPQDLGPIVEIAVARGVHPERGIDLILRNYGLCQAITACESLFGQGLDVSTRDRCVRMLVRAIHADLLLRINQEIQQRESSAEPHSTLASSVAGRDWLFEDDNYHVDTSHLNAIVRMARMLGPCDEIELAADLCEYGRKLSSRYRYPDPPPFEDVYSDSLTFFRVLVGHDAEAGLTLFRTKAEAADISKVGAYPAEVYLHLLRQTGRLRDAVAFASKHLVGVAGPIANSVNQVCEEAGAYEVMAALARDRDDPLTFLAAMLAGKSTPSSS